ncbi:MAG: hypothetical protein J2O49_04660 [Sciscionella sp.]|nr:hypothetical protein [Sciscionella sp.]
MPPPYLRAKLAGRFSPKAAERPISPQWTVRRDAGASTDRDAVARTG